MKRALCILAAAAAVAGCASREKTYSGGTSSTMSGAGSEQTAVIQPSELSPEQIRLVQRSLGERGFAVDPSGSFDDRTQTALMDFQRARGLPATGNLTQPTVEALGLDPRDVTPVRGTRPEPVQPAPAQPDAMHPGTGDQPGMGDGQMHPPSGGY